MNCNIRNYTEQGGGVTHIGGKLIIEKGAEVEGLDGGSGSYTLPTAAADTVAPQMDKQDDSTAEDTGGIVTDFNALLAKLKASGLMKSE